jgi:glycosyltransferase involved in cell wall biosynthesis
MATVCLNMIVKNEAPVIRRCLESVLPFIDTWLISDTGSSDDTQEIIRETLYQKEGTLVNSPWVNFGHNRSQAIKLARDQADYLLFIDADEELILPAGTHDKSLTGDAYYLEVLYGNTRYSRCALVSTKLDWYWKGAVHEYLECRQPFKIQKLPGVQIKVNHDGARSRDPDTYRRDAELLQSELQIDPSDTRSAFYLAQSYRDAGLYHQSFEAYTHRAEMGGFPEEVWYSLYQMAALEERFDSAVTNPGKVSHAYLRAFQSRPTRAEPLIRLARYHRLRKEYELAYIYARRAVDIHEPDDLLFIERDVYAWRSYDELAVAASYTQYKNSTGKWAMQSLLNDKLYPPTEEARISDNAKFYGLSP